MGNRKKVLAMPNKENKSSKAKKATVGSLEKKAAELAAEISGIRKKVLRNESVLRKKIAEKSRAEASLNQLLRKRFTAEKAVLARVKRSAAKKQASLKQRISSLEKVNRIYDEKKARISEAKRKQSALKRQLNSLEKQAGVLGHYG